MSRKINDVWCQLLSKIIIEGNESKPRDMAVKEIIGNQTVIDMSNPILSVPERKMGYKFMCAEAWWILSGRNDVESIAPYSKAISSFSNNGINFDGAYGPKVIDQLTYVVDVLSSDNDTRQAVINIWRENPRDSKDIPCTLSAQFLIRDGVLHCVDTMRSSDAWLGWVYDVFNFTCLSIYIALCLRERGINVELGTLTLNAGSQHLYERNFPVAKQIMQKYAVNRYQDYNLAVKTPGVSLDNYVSPSHFVKRLKFAADSPTPVFACPVKGISCLGEA